MFKFLNLNFGKYRKKYNLFSTFFSWLIRKTTTEAVSAIFEQILQNASTTTIKMLIIIIF